jgi:hypothetical protein
MQALEQMRNEKFMSYMPEERKNKYNGGKRKNSQQHFCRDWRALTLGKCHMKFNVSDN